jgi:hypothetical protein
LVVWGLRPPIRPFSERSERNTEENPFAYFGFWVFFSSKIELKSLLG